RRFGKLPAGLLLRAESPRWGTRVLTIESLPGWIGGKPCPVQVPAQLRNPHPAVAALRDADPPSGARPATDPSAATPPSADGGPPQHRVTGSRLQLHRGTCTGGPNALPLTSGSMCADMTSGFTSSSRMT